MKKKSYGGLLIVLIVCLLAFAFGAVAGMAHIGEDFCKEIIPTSLTRSSDVVQKIDEKSFQPENITVKFQTQTKVKQVAKNNTNQSYYNYSNNSNNNNYSRNSYSNYSR